MKKSRIRLFRNASNTISVLGIILVIATIIIAAYLGVMIVSNNITKDVSSAAHHDKLAQLNNEYAQLENKLNQINKFDFSDKSVYTDAELKLSTAKLAIDDINSGLSTNQPTTEVDERIKTAEKDLKIASDAINKL
ncbi:hypothetical protein [Methanobrevibacter curvatus]|uniref:Uncharacterized protein n=1 Tax=Methanobrevibacter curvatus TaxID=49547 RepID=A0A166CC99_9EURY|nr:hypothetical protein [Methanobrevibacter curvatus]KZX14359.1 hypothetical protein MBCUR_05830 [Methanobrevibacter curvatus]